MICRVFQKNSGGKKTHISGIMRLESIGNELGSSGLPPLLDSSPYIARSTKPTMIESSSTYVSCFSNPIDVAPPQRNQGGIFDSSGNSLLGIPRIPLSASFYSAQSQPPNLPLPPGSVYSMQDHTILRALLENHGSTSRNGGDKMVSISQVTALTSDINPEISSVMASNFDMGRKAFENQHNPVDLDSLWNY